MWMGLWCKTNCSVTNTEKNSILNNIFRQQYYFENVTNADKQSNGYLWDDRGVPRIFGGEKGQFEIIAAI